MTAAGLDQELDRLEPSLPPRIARFMRWVRQPSARWVRWPLGLILIVGGALAILPVFGLWMIPLGLVLIAQDVPFLQRPLARLVAWVNDRWMRRREAQPSVSRRGR
jgi:hypothetical protein